jgi:DNA repair exonuclease SbcCD ATPase subunit
MFEQPLASGRRGAFGVILSLACFTLWRTAQPAPRRIELFGVQIGEDRLEEAVKRLKEMKHLLAKFEDMPPPVTLPSSQEVIEAEQKLEEIEEKVEQDVVEFEDAIKDKSGSWVAVEKLANEVHELEEVLPVLTADANAAGAVKELAAVISEAIVEVQGSMDESDVGSGDYSRARAMSSK